MMRNNKCIVLYLFLLLLCFNLSAQNNKYSIIGLTSSTDDGKEVMLFNLLGDSICSVDTTIIRGGKYYFEGFENKKDIYILTYGNYPSQVKSVELILEQGDIVVHMDSITIVEGTYLNDLYTGYKNKMTGYRKAREEYTETEDYSILDGLNKHHYEYCKTFIEENIFNVVGAKVFIDQMHVLKKTDFYSIIRSNPLLFENLSVVEYLNEYDTNEELNWQRRALIGNSFIDFELLSSSGSVKRISDYIGHSDYVLIDIWASWCSPCIAEIPYIKELYEKYDRNTLNILSISIDVRKNAWMNALARLDMSWESLLIRSDKEAELKNMYHFQGIPYYILIDKKGIIVDVSQGGGSLKSLINLIFNP